MSSFEIKPTGDIPHCPDYLISVKPTDEKWKDFPTCVLLNEFAGIAEKLKKTKIHGDDFIISCYPGCGTAIIIVQEMAWLILNDFDFDKAKCIATDKKFPVMEGFEMTHEGKVSKNLDELPRPRTMETHLPVQLLPDEIWTKKPYMINISRDPRDVAVSTYYTAKEKFHMPLSKDEFLERFLKDQNVYAPYREHRLNFWNIPDYPNILYLTYEWITENMDDAIWKVAGFLGKTISEENSHKLREYLKDSMEKGGINRKSKAGRYKEEMSPEIQEKFDVWMAEEATMVSAFKK